MSIRVFSSLAICVRVTSDDEPQSRYQFPSRSITMCGNEATESQAQTSRSSAVNNHTHRTLPAIKDIIPPVIKKKRTRHVLPPIREDNFSSLPLTSPDVASEFTLFPRLIPELRLMIWQLAAALPTLTGKLLYPHQKGCWIFEDVAWNQIRTAKTCISGSTPLDSNLFTAPYHSTLSTAKPAMSYSSGYASRA